MPISHPRGLQGVRVIELSSRIAGAYAGKLFADAGAEVLLVEPPGGNPLRRLPEAPDDGAASDRPLFRFLNASKTSLVARPGDAAMASALAEADLVIETLEPGEIDALEIRRRSPGMVVLSISSFGRSGTWSKRPATEFIVQAESGSLAGRGLPSRPPLMAGGRIGEWAGGCYGAVAALAALRHARATGKGEHVDCSLLEVMTLASTLFADLFHRLAGSPPIRRPQRSVEVPSIEPTLDGWVGFTTNSRQQYTDFLLLIERQDLLADQDLATMAGRIRRTAEWNEIVRSWTRRHTTADIVERAALLRIPVAPVHDGSSVTEHVHFRERKVFEPHTSGDFVQPRPPYRIDGVRIREPSPTPRLGEIPGRWSIPRSFTALQAPSGELPLTGLRVLDATAWWAGPAACHALACLGAEVIHLEATQRLDGARLVSGPLGASRDHLWELAPLFLSTNTNKRGLTLNLADPRGLDLCKRLIRHCDVVMENFSPRVFESFGLDWETLREASPQTILVRMPAFGLDGPWRDHVGFAQTMEQISGLAWLTGYADDQPRVQSGPCDPIAGMHAAFAALVAIVERDSSGRGHFVECPMVESALNVAAEAIVEYSAHGNLMRRNGNRAPWAAPQGLYACRGDEQWLALSIETNDQWQRLKLALGRPAWAERAALDRHEGRRAEHDAIDAELRRWASEQELASALEELLRHAVPAGRVVDGRLTSMHPQHAARGFYEEVTHPIAGVHPLAGMPFRFESVKRWIRSPAPTLGQHNESLLTELLDLEQAEIERLTAEGVIGTRPGGAPPAAPR